MCDAAKRPVLKGYSSDGKICYLYQVRCKQWSCVPCANANRVEWQAKIGHGYDIYKSSGIEDWTFVTITSHKTLKTANQCLYVFGKAWPRLYARLKRRDKTVKYVMIPEYHKDGRVHWHSIMSGGVSKRWIKDACATTGLGYISDSDKITDSWQAISYVSKYLSKSCGLHEWPGKLRRIRTSTKWPEPPKYDPEGIDVSDWQYLSTYPAEGIDYLAEGIAEYEGIRVKVLQPGTVTPLTRAAKEIIICP